MKSNYFSGMFTLWLMVFGPGCETIKEGDSCDSPGKYACASTSVVFYCTSSATWHKQYDCDPGACATSSDDTSYSCESESRATTEGTSASGDPGPSSPPAECSPGEETCSGNQVQYCSDGQWQALLDCGDLRCAESASAADCT